MLENNLIDQEQEEFMQNKNTTRSLFRLKVEFEIMKKSKLKAALITLDLEKAFDSAWHNGLLFKLWIAGIRGPLFKILQTFSKNRLVRTRLEGESVSKYSRNNVFPRAAYFHHYSSYFI